MPLASKDCHGNVAPCCPCLLHLWICIKVMGNPAQLWPIAHVHIASVLTICVLYTLLYMVSWGVHLARAILTYNNNVYEL